ncbi:MAG: 50S ribosomal protein L13 [Thermoplasmata archaeon]|nr:50S ribosomal protein L13 [Thermoplasmata archaeon]
MQVIDGSEHILGRLATHVAKQVINGEDVVVLNAERIIITGSKESILKDYQQRRNRGVKGRNRRGPYYPKMPDRMFRRSVRGMIPYQEPKGRSAFKRLSVYIGVPSEHEGSESIKVETAVDRGATKKVYLGEIAKMLGAKF